MNDPVKEIQSCIDALDRLSFHTKHTQEAYSGVYQVKVKLKRLAEDLADFAKTQPKDKQSEGEPS